jgi:hypothetical protein
MRACASDEPGDPSLARRVKTKDRRLTASSAGPLSESGELVDHASINGTHAARGWIEINASRCISTPDGSPPRILGSSVPYRLAGMRGHERVAILLAALGRVTLPAGDVEPAG